MNDQLDLSNVLTQTMQFLGYSNKLTNQALDDLEKLISMRFYNKLIILLPESIINEAKVEDIKSIAELCKANIKQNILDRTLIDITRETINEYFEEISKN